MVACTERRWPTLVLTPIQVSNSIITVTDTVGLHVKQQITLSLGALQKDFEIKRVISKTQLKVGPKQELKGSSFNVFCNPSEFDGGTLTVVEQERNKVSWDIVGRSVYAEEPIVALRNVLVDRYGQYYTADNPLSVQLSDGSINIGSVNAELEVQLSHVDNYPDSGDVHDSIRIGSGTAGEYLTIYPSGDIDVRSIGRTPEEKLKGDLLCAADIRRVPTWAEIDGVRRITKLVFTSLQLNAATSQTITLTRDFTYQLADPFDLIDIQDTLTVI